jgi:short-subunit dehydrogenase
MFQLAVDPSRLMQLNGASVLVMGATGGIGRAVTAGLVQAGSKVVAAGRDERRLAELSDSWGIDTVAFDLQAGKWSDGQLPQVPGGWNLVVLCAGVGHSAALAGHTDADLDRLFLINTVAPIRMIRDLMPLLADPPAERRLALIGSIAGILGVPFEAPYAASKSALMIFADSLRVELDGAGIGVTIVNPGVVDTGFFDRRGVPYHRRFPRPVSPDRVAAALIKSVRRDRAEVMVPRWLRLPAALRACAPGVYWRLAGRWG